MYCNYSVLLPYFVVIIIWSLSPYVSIWQFKNPLFFFFSLLCRKQRDVFYCRILLERKIGKKFFEKYKQYICSPFLSWTQNELVVTLDQKKSSRDVKIHGSSVLNRTSCIRLQRPSSSLDSILNWGWYKIFSVGSCMQ